MDFSFKTDYSIIFIPVAAILAFLISYYYYKKSRPEGIKKKILTGLRFVTLFLIFMLLSSPVISLIRNISEDPVNVVLIDNSESLLLENRSKLLTDVLNNQVKNSLSGGSENLYFLYSGNLFREINSNETGSINYESINNFETNLTSTFYSLAEKLSNKNVSTITIISDGIINKGGNPVTAARSFNVPVNYILVGDTVQKNDLVLKNLFFNKTAFIESSVPIKAEINSYGYDSDVKVFLYEEDNLIDSKMLAVNRSQNTYSVLFNVSSPAEKSAKYKIEIEGLPGEITLKNNFEEFFVKFVNNKFKILVLSGGPSADFAFISQELKKVKNFEATFLTQKSANEFYEGAVPDLRGFDSYVLIGYPTAQSNTGILNEIKSSLELNNSSLIFFAGRNVDYKKLQVLEDRLPFRVSSISESEEETGIKVVSTLQNDVFKNEELLSSINSFPNIFKSGTVFYQNPSSETFLLMTRNSSPALIYENTQKNKSAAFLAYGLFKWRLSRGKNISEQALNYVLTNVLVAITGKEERKKFSVETTKQVYSKFEDVKFEARITNFDVTGSERIKVKVKGPGFEKDIDLLKKDSRFFEGQINIPSDGNYEYTAELYSGNNYVENIQNRFAVGQDNFEYKLTRADNLILRLLSNETGGKDFTQLSSSDAESFVQATNNKSKSEFKSLQNTELNINPYFLTLVILLMSAEWFLRKRNSLP